jgi:hypothetical protein
MRQIAAQDAAPRHTNLALKLVPRLGKQGAKLSFVVALP